MPLDLSEISTSVKSHICEQLGITEHKLATDVSEFDAIDAWLRYVGIIGYTYQILEVIDSIRAAEASAHWSEMEQTPQ
jgi:hypothetical protein